MLNPYIIQLLAEERREELLRVAAQGRQWRALHADAAGRTTRRPLAEWLAAWRRLRSAGTRSALRRSS